MSNLFTIYIRVCLVGLQYYDGIALSKGQQLKVEFDLNHKYDRNAIKVIHGSIFGYVQKEVAASLAGLGRFNPAVHLSGILAEDVEERKGMKRYEATSAEMILCISGELTIDQQGEVEEIVKVTEKNCYRTSLDVDIGVVGDDTSDNSLSNSVDDNSCEHDDNSNSNESDGDNCENDDNSNYNSNEGGENDDDNCDFTSNDNSISNVNDVLSGSADVDAVLEGREFVNSEEVREYVYDSSTEEEVEAACLDQQKRRVKRCRKVITNLQDFNCTLQAEFNELKADVEIKKIVNDDLEKVNEDLRKRLTQIGKITNLI